MKMAQVLEGVETRNPYNRERDIISICFCLLYTSYFGTPEQVAQETERVLDIFGGENYIAGAGCALPSNTPEANIRAFVDTAKGWKRK